MGAQRRHRLARAAVRGRFQDGAVSLDEAVALVKSAKATISAGESAPPGPGVLRDVLDYRPRVVIGAKRLARLLRHGVPVDRSTDVE